jgi:hypothetical protein
VTVDAVLVGADGGVSLRTAPRGRDAIVVPVMPPLHVHWTPNDRSAMAPAPAVTRTFWRVSPWGATTAIYVEHVEE